MEPIGLILSEHTASSITSIISGAAFVLISTPILGYGITRGKGRSPAVRIRLTLMTMFAVFVFFVIFTLVAFPKDAATVVISGAAFVLVTAAIIGFAIILGKKRTLTVRIGLTISAVLAILVCFVVSAVIALPHLMPIW